MAFLQCVAKVRSSALQKYHVSAKKYRILNPNVFYEHNLPENIFEEIFGYFTKKKKKPKKHSNAINTGFLSVQDETD